MRTLRNPSVILILSDPALNSKPASSFTATLLRCCFCLFRVRGALFSIQSPRPDQRRVSRSPASPKTMRFGLRGLCSLELAQALCCCPSPSFAVAQPRPPLLAPWRGIFSRIPSMITHLSEVRRRRTGLAGVTIHHLACFVSPMHGVPPPTPKSASTHVVRTWLSCWAHPRVQPSSIRSRPRV